MQEQIQNLENEIRELKARNSRVELDKAWETSFTRRIFIMVATYIVAAIWLVLIEDSMPWLKALVPAVGYALSTLSLPILKNWWSKREAGSLSRTFTDSSENVPTIAPVRNIPEKIIDTETSYPLKVFIYCAIWALAFALATVLWTSETAKGPDDLYDVSFGWPKAYLSQDLSALEPPEDWYPYTVGFGSPLEYPTRVDYASLIFNWTVIAAAFPIFYFIFKYLNFFRRG